MPDQRAVRGRFADDQRTERAQRIGACVDDRSGAFAAGFLATRENQLDAASALQQVPMRDAGRDERRDAGLFSLEPCP
nr:hypothetical protein [Burkholderia lata]